MTKQKNTNDLGYLGEEYQLKLVKCFIEHSGFFGNIQHIVDQNMFTNEHLRRIVGFMKDRYASLEVVATYFDLETLIRINVSNPISVEMGISILN